MTELFEDLDVRALFREPPDAFIAARDALARTRKGSPGATAIKGLRKPTVPAWALNQLSARDPEGIDALLDAGAELKAAQGAALTSTKHAARLRDATTARRATVASLMASARSILVESGRSPDPHVDAIAATLEAASTDERAAGLLRTGTFVRPIRKKGDFGAMFGLQAVPDLPPDPVPRDGAQDAGDAGDSSVDAGASRRARAQGAARRAAAHAEVQRLRRDRTAAERRAFRTRETADRLAAEAQAIRDRLDVVESKGREATRLARAAEDDATKAAAAHEHAVADLDLIDG